MCAWMLCDLYLTFNEGSDGPVSDDKGPGGGPVHVNEGPDCGHIWMIVLLMSTGGDLVWVGPGGVARPAMA